MYLLTRGWSLGHTSLAMTPEHSDISAEYCCLKPARAEHSRSMCLSSPKAHVRHNLQTRLLQGNRTCLPEAKVDETKPKALLDEFDIVFQPLPKELPPFRDDTGHTIPLQPGASPPYRPAYRFSPLELREVRKQLQELLENKFIQPSRSPYGAIAEKLGRAPPKKNGAPDSLSSEEGWNITHVHRLSCTKQNNNS